MYSWHHVSSGGTFDQERTIGKIPLTKTGRPTGQPARFVLQHFRRFQGFQNLDKNEELGSGPIFLERRRLPETNSSHQKMDGWKTILSFWVSAYFQVRLLLVKGRGISQTQRFGIDL